MKKGQKNVNFAQSSLQANEVPLTKKVGPAEAKLKSMMNKKVETPAVASGICKEGRPKVGKLKSEAEEMGEEINE